MGNLREIERELKKAARLLLLIPFLFTVLIPNGYMPTALPEGGFTVTLCTPEGLRTVTLDANGQEIPDPSDQENESSSHCIFSAQSVVEAGLLPSDFHVPDIDQSVSWHVREFRVSSLRTTASLGARAPPFSA